MKICRHCLMALKSKGEIDVYKTIDIELEFEENKPVFCEWCGEPIEDGELYEI